MRREETWKNFDLGMEIQIAGTFIYNGVRAFHDMTTLAHAEEVFEFFYGVSVGLERLLKVAVVLLEHDEARDARGFEASLITHNHLALLARVRKGAPVALGKPHTKFLGLLSSFYKSFRYDRYTLSGPWQPDKEKAALRAFLEAELKVRLESSSSMFPSQNSDRFKKYVSKLVTKISGEIYRIIRDRAVSLNLYTYEIRDGSKAAKIFVTRDCSFAAEDVLWKELLVYFMNTKDQTAQLEYLRSIVPLGFEAGLVNDYLQCFRSERQSQGAVIDELEGHYAEIEKPKERLATMSVIGDPNVYFDDEDDEGVEDGG